MIENNRINKKKAPKKEKQKDKRKTEMKETKTG